MIMQQKSLAIEQGLRITELRQKTHLTRRMFALRHNFSPGTLQNWECGRYQGLSMGAAESLLAAFKREGIQCSLEWLLHGKGQEPSFHGIITSNSQAHPLIIEAEKNAHIFELNDKFYQAVKNGRHAEAVKLIKQGVDVHLKSGFELRPYNNDANTPLHISAENGYIELVKSLLRLKADPNVTNRRNQTPLHFAVERGYKEIISCLIAHGAQIDPRENEGDTPLSWAAYTGQTDIVLQLCDFGAEINATNFDGNTSLHWSAYKGHVDIVETLIYKGADYNLKNKHGETALLLATRYGKIEVVKYLLNVHSS